MIEHIAGVIFNIMLFWLCLKLLTTLPVRPPNHEMRGTMFTILRKMRLT